MNFITAGESHGPALTTIVSGMPAGVPIELDHINADLARRQGGYGRGGRQKIETDTAAISSGVRFAKSLGTPITLTIVNDDHANWTDRMAVCGAAPQDLVRETHPRPGHADLVGMLKTNTHDARDILERSSARETAARVAAGGVAKELLAAFGVSVGSYVSRIGEAVLPEGVYMPAQAAGSECSCPDEATTEAMKAQIDAARAVGDSLGGEFVVVVEGLVSGLGSYASGPERLTSQLGAAVFSIPAIKGVEFGMGFDVASIPGSRVHDGISYDAQAHAFSRMGNNAGGLEGGMTTGEPLRITAAMKPIPTLMKPLDTVDIDTHEAVKASKERSDTCAVPAAAVVAEAEVAMVLANAYTERFGHDCLEDMLAARDAYLARIERF